jgi:hypothetical protein
MVDNNSESNKGTNNLKSNQDAKVDYDKKNIIIMICVMKD